MYLKVEELLKENWIPHNCNDDRIIKWCIDNLDSEHFDWVFGGSDFGCSCDSEDIGIYKIYIDDDCWEKWMSELNDGELRIYYCFDCKEWAIDNDQ